MAAVQAGGASHGGAQMGSVGPGCHCGCLGLLRQPGTVPSAAYLQSHGVALHTGATCHGFALVHSQSRIQSRDGFALCRDLLTLTTLRQPAWGSMLFSGPAFDQMHEPAGILGVSSSMCYKHLSHPNMYCYLSTGHSDVCPAR